MKDVFSEMLDPDEKVLWSSKPHFWVFILNCSWMLVLGVLYSFFIVGDMPDVEGKDGTFLFVVRHIFTWVGLAALIYALLVYPNTFYACTNKRLIFRTGFFGIDYKIIDYDRISNIEVNVNPIENLFNLGTIKVFSGEIGPNGRSLTCNMLSIPYPNDTFKRIKKITMDIKTDMQYPNAYRPEQNQGYNTKYQPKNEDKREQ